MGAVPQTNDWVGEARMINMMQTMTGRGALFCRDANELNSSRIHKVLASCGASQGSRREETKHVPMYAKEMM